MTKVYDVCLAKKNAKGEYVKTKEGKGVYKNFGSIVKDDKGYLSLVLETMHGDVWFSLFEAKAKTEEPKAGEEYQKIDVSEIPDTF